MAAIFVDTLIRLKREGFRPDRDIILALTADEELGSSSKYNGVRWLLANHRDLIEAELAINEGGGGRDPRRPAPVNRLQTGEKVYRSTSAWRSRTPAATARGRARTTPSTSSPKAWCG